MRGSRRACARALSRRSDAPPPPPPLRGSYVSSAYIPACLRHGGRPTLSNAHRANECAQSAGTLRDELDEVITLNSVSIIVAEYARAGSAYAYARASISASRMARPFVICVSPRACADMHGPCG